MCGIAGAFLFDPRAEVDAATITTMTEVIRHRGPDDGGVWVQGPVGLGNRRLAVIDLSPRGHQPMSYQGRFHIAFNGEIYNFPELRARLERDGHVFQSDSDTEVILHLYAEKRNYLDSTPLWTFSCLRRWQRAFTFQHLKQWRAERHA